MQKMQSTKKSDTARHDNNIVVSISEMMSNPCIAGTDTQITNTIAHTAQKFNGNFCNK